MGLLGVGTPDPYEHKFTPKWEHTETQLNYLTKVVGIVSLSPTRSIWGAAGKKLEAQRIESA